MASRTSERLAISIANQCTNVKYENQMELYTLPLETVCVSANRYSFGRPNIIECSTSKTILLVGETGSGKTTMINAMINYILGVEWDDSFRFILIDEEVKGGSQAHSQTEKVSVYDLHFQNGFRIPFSLTIVDTPGFGDTRGIARDKEITSAIAHLFKDKNGIEELDAVGFVVQAARGRLNDSQKYVFNSVLSMFGKDVKNNVVFLATTAVGKKQPLVLDAIKEAKLPCRLDSNGLPCHQKFDNGVIYADNKDDEYTDKNWKNGMENFKLFFDELSDMPTKSLQMTMAVVDYRKQLEMKIQWTKDAIPRLFTEMEELRTKEVAVKFRKLQVDAHQNFEIKVKVSRKVKVPVDRLTAMNCTKCETTCHYPCRPYLPMGWCPAFSSEKQKNILGLATDKGTRSFIQADCNVCPGRCSSITHHKNEQHRWIYEEVEETQTLENVRQKYEKAMGKKMDAEELMEALRKDSNLLKKEIFKTISEIKDLHNKLKKNALHGNPLTTSEYIRMQIENEEKERKEGFGERITILEELLLLV